jgi:hypothetical protein
MSPGLVAVVLKFIWKNYSGKTQMKEDFMDNQTFRFSLILLYSTTIIKINCIIWPLLNADKN